MKNPTVVFVEAKKAVIEDRPVPKAGDNEVIIETTRTLISTGTELTMYSGDFPKGSGWADYIKYPMLPGYSNVGKVVETGKNVDKSWVGKKVISYGTHAAYSNVSINEMWEIDGKADEDIAAFFALAQITMNGVRGGFVSWGDSVVVYGLGLIGQLALRFMEVAGARPIIAVDVSEHRLGLLPKKSHIYPVNPSKQDVVKLVKELTKGRMADLVYEVTGNQNLIPGEFAPLKKQGKFVVLSSPRGPSTFDFNDLCNVNSYTIIGVHNGSHPAAETPFNVWTKARHNEFFLNLTTSNTIDVKSLISHKAKFDKATEFYRMLYEDRSRAMGCIIDWK